MKKAFFLFLVAVFMGAIFARPAKKNAKVTGGENAAKANVESGEKSSEFINGGALNASPEKSATKNVAQASSTEKIEIDTSIAPKTFGWADAGKISYPKTESVVVIDDETFSDPQKKRKAFTNAIAKGNSIIVLKGEVDLSDGKISDADHSYFEEFSKSGGARLHSDISFSIASNTTLIGGEGAKIKFGGLFARDASNIIICNIEFYDAHGSTDTDTKIKQNSKASIDSLNLRNVSDIWIDHCTFSDGVCVDLERNFNHDGSLDIHDVGRFVTISYCEFKNHDKVILIGAGDSMIDPNERTVTLHHNYFHTVVQRLPRTRGCYAHIYNNFFDKIGVPKNSGSSLGPGIASHFIVENNFFGKHEGAIVKFYDKSKSQNEKTFSLFYHSGNIPKIMSAMAAYDKVDFAKDFKKHEVSEKPWKIPYDYSLEEAENLSKTIPNFAGSGKQIFLNGKKY